MGTYSHSKLNTFEQCRKKFKFSYIDKIRIDHDTIELFLGKLVHEVLEKLYRDLKEGKMMELEELIDLYDKMWDDKWHDGIEIVKTNRTAEDYRLAGKQCVRGYYMKHHPFDYGDTIGIETTDYLDIGEGHKMHVRIDRLVDMGNDVYEVHDFKTSGRLPQQNDLDKDRQLALYSMWVREKYKAQDVRLVWHYLLFDKELDSFRTEDQLESLRKDILEKIKKIESAVDYPANPMILCNWCDYKDMCGEAQLFNR